MAPDSELWGTLFGGMPGDFRDAPFDFDVENHEADFGAIWDGATPIDTALIFDRGPGGAHPEAGVDTLPQYLIEYDNPTAGLFLNGAPVAVGQEIAAADLGSLSWNSVFNTGGTVTFAVADNDGLYSAPDNTLTISPTVAVPRRRFGALIEDQHLTVLA